MLNIFETRGIKHTNDRNTTLATSCPKCKRGNLVNKFYRKWVTVYFVPVIPLEVFDRFYECDQCKCTYNESIKSTLQRSQQDIHSAQKEARATFAKALVASMTHMSTIAGGCCQEKEYEIKNTIRKFPGLNAELIAIFQNIRNDENQEDQIFYLLNEARNQMSSETLMNLLVEATAVLITDGLIKKEEELLLKKYLMACGLPKELYHTIIEKLENTALIEINAA